MASYKILLVEDHTELAETVGAFLESSGSTVDYAADGSIALHLAVTEIYDAIVLDIQLPGVDGLEVCRRLRNEAKLTTPIIMLTARDQLEDKLKGFDSGADDYLLKPFDLPELVARLRPSCAEAKACLHVTKLANSALISIPSKFIEKATHSPCRAQASKYCGP